MASFDSYFGDEELDDGVTNGGFSDVVTAGQRRDVDAQDQGSERRLSRELEAGFRDDSDSEEERDRGIRIR